MNAVVRILVISLVLAWMTGCGTIKSVKEEFLPDKKKTDYREAGEAPTLEVPPDLTSSSIDDGLVVPDITPASGSASLSDYSRERVNTQTIRTAGVLPKQDNIRVMRDKNTHWLVIQGLTARKMMYTHRQNEASMRICQNRPSSRNSQPWLPNQ